MNAGGRLAPSLAAVHTRVGNPVPFDFCLWLSLNPENDGTAIWVEKKFDMPGAGAWVSERVFSIPLVPGAASRSPGLVVFECTPLYGEDDEIEKCVLFSTGKKWELMSPGDFCAGNTGFWMTVHDYVKLSRRFPMIDILFPRFCLFFGTRTILRRYQMICDIWYVDRDVNRRRHSRAIGRRLRGERQRQAPMRHFLCHHQKRKDLDEKFGRVAGFDGFVHGWRTRGNPVPAR